MTPYDETWKAGMMHHTKSDIIDILGEGLEEMHQLADADRGMIDCLTKKCGELQQELDISDNNSAKLFQRVADLEKERDYYKLLAESVRMGGEK